MGGLFGVILYLLPQPFDMHGKGLRLGEAVKAPYFIEQEGLVHGLARVLHEQKQKIKFLLCQLETFIALEGGALVLV